MTIRLRSTYPETASMPLRGVEKKKCRFSFLAKSITYVTDFGGTFLCRFSAHQDIVVSPWALKSFCANMGLAILLCLAGCASNPQARLERYCPSCTYTEIAIPGELSPLSVLSKVPNHASRQRMHVYLEGDGRPWSRWNMPADDPNSRRLTALQLMQLDKTSSIYLNRPCYGVSIMPGGCDSHLWTSHRYSEEVVAALNHGLEQMKQRYGVKELVLIGHSGGGTLAMLLAQRRADVAAVLTLAANLDQQAWTEHFHYLPLMGSLNAVSVDLPPHIHRWHFAGELDQQVPAPLIQQAAARDRYARIRTVESFDHACCWAEVWPGVLEELLEQLEENAASPRS